MTNPTDTARKSEGSEMPDKNSSETWLSFMGGIAVEAKEKLRDITNFVAASSSEQTKEYLKKCDRLYHCIGTMTEQARMAVETRTAPQPDQPSDESRARALEWVDEVSNLESDIPESELLRACKRQEEIKATIRSALTAQKPAAVVDLEWLIMQESFAAYPHVKDLSDDNPVARSIRRLAAQGCLTQPTKGQKNAE